MTKRPIGYNRANTDVSAQLAGGLCADPAPDAEAVLIKLLRQAPPWRKLEMVGQLNQAVRTLALAGLRQRYPQADESELRRRLADLLLGPDLAELAYGPLIVPEQAHDR